MTTVVFDDGKGKSQSWEAFYKDDHDFATHSGFGIDRKEALMQLKQALISTRDELTSAIQSVDDMI